MNNEISIPIAFLGGVISFFAPCVVPLLPAYVSYITGVSLKDLKDKGYKPFIKKILISSLLYILGFSLIFVILGTSAAGLGIFLRKNSLAIQRIGGAIIVVLGLEFGGFINLPFLKHQKSLNLPKWSKNLGELRAFLIGVIFATAWSPCVGAVLGSILALAAISKTALQGAFLLFVYSLGISIPFLIVSLTLASSPKYINIITRKIEAISKVAAIILILLGMMMLTDTYKYLNQAVFSFTFKIGY